MHARPQVLGDVPNGGNYLVQDVVHFLVVPIEIANGASLAGVRIRERLPRRSTADW
jgi:hypothetical protein